VVDEAGRVGRDPEGLGGGVREGGRLELVAVGGEHLEAVPQRVETGGRSLVRGEGQGDGREQLVGVDIGGTAVPGNGMEAPLQRHTAGPVVPQPHL
jgi:hypothetical protein